MRLPAVPLLVLCLLVLHAACASGLPAQSLRGSRGSVDRMYNQALKHDLHFFSTGRGIRNAASEGRMVRLRSGRDYALVGVSYPYVRPATRTFVDRLAAQYRAACGERLVITSAARPRSMRIFNSVNKTVHPTGMAVDLRRSRNGRCRTWLRRTLLALEKEGVLEATEENRPPHFHVAVFPAPYQQYVAELSGSGSRGRAAAASGGSATERYRVRAGDSLWSIARRHSTTVARLKAVNDLRSSTVRPGQTLVIPRRGAE